MVLPNGNFMKLGGKTKKNVTGYNLKDLFVGSEGTLGIITKAYMKLIPYPKEKFLLWALFDDFGKGIEAITKVYESGFAPSTIEFVEGDAFKAVEKLINIKIPNSHYPAHLLIEIDGFNFENVKAQAEKLSKIILKNSAQDVLVIPYEHKQHQIWELRRKISEANNFISYNKRSDDVVIPPSHLKDFLNEVKDIENKYGIKIICFGHLGDGNVHINILNINDETGFTWEKFKNDLVRSVFEITKKYNGALSGEHGIGLTKKPYLDMFLDKEQIKIHKKVKKIFDPKNICNPGKIW